MLSKEVLDRYSKGEDLYKILGMDQISKNAYRELIEYCIEFQIPLRFENDGGQRFTKALNEYGGFSLIDNNWIVFTLLPKIRKDYINQESWWYPDNTYGVTKNFYWYVIQNYLDQEAKLIRRFKADKDSTSRINTGFETPEQYIKYAKLINDSSLMKNYILSLPYENRTLDYMAHDLHCNSGAHLSNKINSLNCRCYLTDRYYSNPESEIREYLMNTYHLEYYECYKTKQELQYPGSSYSLEIDLFIPKYQLGIEYDSEHPMYYDENGDLVYSHNKSSQVYENWKSKIAEDLHGIKIFHIWSSDYEDLDIRLEIYKELDSVIRSRAPING